jgi:4-diphosphocytidyl-2-C-methyl-D-erythritol kinase
VIVTAPGKINVFFAVGPLLPDGFHSVASVYQALELREEISVAASASWLVEVSGSLPEEQLQMVPTGEENLVVRAAKLIAELAGHPEAKPVAFDIFKNVPVAGGMGGGSADAAAALLAVNRLWQTEITHEQLIRESVKLGADVPFALLGGTAIGLGRGEQLEPIIDVKPLNWVLVTSLDGLSTPAVYGRLDELRAERGIDPSNLPEPVVPIALVEALVEGDPLKLAPLLKNDLQEAAIDLKPELAEVIAAGVAAGALTGIVSGSGPTIVFLADSEDSANTIANILSLTGHDAIVTTGPSVGTILEIN